MKIIEISASFQRTIQIEPYEPVSIFSAVKAELAEGDDRKKCNKELFDLVREDVRLQEAEIRENKKKRDNPEIKMTASAPYEGDGEEVRAKEVEDYNQKMKS